MEGDSSIGIRQVGLGVIELEWQTSSGFALRVGSPDTCYVVIPPCPCKSSPCIISPKSMPMPTTVGTKLHIRAWKLNPRACSLA